jgi:hypothetical protein
MDELSEEDKLTVSRARKIQRFLSQPFQVAEVFTGHAGKLVPLEETIKVSSTMHNNCNPWRHAFVFKIYSSYHPFSSPFLSENMCCISSFIVNTQKFTEKLLKYHSSWL